MAGASPSPHKPRRKLKQGNGSDKPARARPEALVRAPSFPLAAFMWPARTSSTQWEVLPVILMVVGLFRWAAGLWGYSGFQRPPMFGDYEAQRHWMEVTAHLPISQWYFHDLQWWGLDYPPLTAYHSWLMGKIGCLIEPAWFALFTSRGSDDPTLKIFMRATVIISEYLIYIPAAVVFARRYSRLSGVATWTSSVALVAILMQPATILVDHVHFQYNTVMLGLVLASINSMLAERYKWAAVFFVAALGFKQMALYYAFSVFAYLLGKCVQPRINIMRLTGIGLVTIASFAVLVLPLVIGTLYDRHRGIDSWPDVDGPPPPLPLFPFVAQYLDTRSALYAVIEQMIQMVYRIFPFSRGLFEDKVANFWCAMNVVVKLRNLPTDLLQKAALGATLLSIIPPNLVLFIRPDKKLLPLAFAATAWGFFLFSYQVHEKSVLLPLMPMTLLLAGKQGLNGDTRSWVGFANLLGAWTMFPLLSRVDLAVPYTVLTLLWAYLVGLPPTCWTAPFMEAGPAPKQWAVAIIHSCFYIFMGVWHVVNAIVPPPADKPDLWVVANVGVGCAGFMLCYLWCFWKLLVDSGLVAWQSPKTKTQ
ncbi:ALG6, ALG8 domain (glycosyl transferase family 58) protein [Metarhizium robertsii]|uniref:Alpha-1,3-glucosyltransferase n=2 Tax=Metarhizium robertsii TaxID=568076 RepID=E9ETN5_METRA|nr:glycosyltransferase family 57 protein [Metarhizium robertsii ARSEF 23]EFZ00788.1 glycosyltransferase family 57 protein [Metarhizium robertsii ARSEF 23]EXV03309.1 ALG6, ALG8 domain (glycosyl transferase family 58) protein [Metarhizium robertsii]